MHQQSMNTSFIEDIDAKTRLAGSNKLEMLLFTLGTDDANGKLEHFGMNVFKVVEVIPIHSVEITAIPGAGPCVAGMVSLRGNIVSVIDLAKAIDLNVPQEQFKILIVTEFNRHVQAFMAHDVDTIVRLDWEAMQEPPQWANSGSTAVTSITRLDDGRIIQVLDVEKVMSNVLNFDAASMINEEAIRESAIDEVLKNKTVFFADDSSFARDQLRAIFTAAGVTSESANNGIEAWQKLDAMANASVASGEPFADRVPIIVTDIEMPGLDGFTLTKRIKQDKRFDGVKVLMHSSMSGRSNIELGRQVGVDGYLAKFDAKELSETIKSVLS